MLLYDSKRSRKLSRVADRISRLDLAAASLNLDHLRHLPRVYNSRHHSLQVSATGHTGALRPGSLELPEVEGVFVRREPKIVIALPTQELMFSLNERLQQFPGEKAISVEPPQRFKVDLVDFPTQPSELEEVLDVVQDWVDDIGIESVTVQAEGKAYELRRSRE